MQILTTGKNLDIGDALRDHIESRLASNVDKYFDGAVRAHVVVERQRSSFRTECTVHLTTGLTLHARGQSAEPYGSFDIAVEHLEKRLRRYKRRLRNHHPERRDTATFGAAESLAAPATEALMPRDRKGPPRRPAPNASRRSEP
jgi:ribosomal subunit interface protein